MGDFDKAVEDGVKAGTTGAAVAGTAAAIGAMAGASLGPFAAVAAPIGAAIGALIGFFVSLTGGPSKEERERAAAANAELAKKGREMSALLNFSAIQLGKMTWGTPISLVYVRQLQAQAKQNPGWAPMINAYIQAAHDTKYNPPENDPAFKNLENFITAIASLSPTLALDPFVYLRPPMSVVLGPALKAAGIDISNPATIEMMRGNYDISAAAAVKYRPSPPVIRRKSYQVKLGKIFPGGKNYDQRAFDPVIAPYGLGAISMFPHLLAGTQLTSPEFQDGTWGAPIDAPWPYGLDSDNFAKPQVMPSAGLSRNQKVAGVGIGAGALIYILFFL